MTISKFLISRLSALGDTVCSLPAAVALKNAYPDAHITWAVDPRFAGIIECCVAVDEVVRVKPSLKSMPTYPDRFEAALDLQGLLKSGLCIAKAKATRKVGYHWQREGSWFFSERILPDPSSFHVVDQYVDVARAVGGVMDRAEFGIKPKPEDLIAIQVKLASKGVSGRFVVVNAGAGWATKRWVPASFAKVIDALSDDGVSAVLIGGKADADVAAAQEVIDACKSQPASMLGETGVSELVALIDQCSAHLGGDTGSSHLAAALGRPAIGLYAITKPQRSCPYGQIHRCLYAPEGLAAIQPEPVIGLLREALA